MALKFTCTSCGSIIISKFLRPGEQAICRACGSVSEISESAETVTDREHELWLNVGLPSPSAQRPSSAPGSASSNYQQDQKLPLNTSPPSDFQTADPRSRSVFEYFSLGWESCSGNWGIAVGSIIIYVMYVVFIGLLGFVADYVGDIVNFFIGPALTAGLTSLFMKIVARDHPQIEDMMDGFYRYGSILAIQLIYWTCALVLAVPLGLVIGITSVAALGDPTTYAKLPTMLLVGAFGMIFLGFMLVSMFFLFIYPLVMDRRRVGVIDSFIYSAKIVLPHYWKVLGFYFIGIILLFMSAILLLLPALFMIPVFATGLLHLYYDLRADYELANGPIPLLNGVK